MDKFDAPLTSCVLIITRHFDGALHVANITTDSSSSRVMPFNDSVDGRMNDPAAFG